jgi:hypothetical protein
MTRVIIDAMVGDKLHDLTETVELCDTSGRVLGRFTPAFNASMYESLEPQISEVELLRREQRGGGRTLAEIMADLEKRA